MYGIISMKYPCIINQNKINFFKRKDKDNRKAFKLNSILKTEVISQDTFNEESNKGSDASLGWFLSFFFNLIFFNFYFFIIHMYIQCLGHFSPLPPPPPLPPTPPPPSPPTPLIPGRNYFALISIILLKREYKQ
jgi:hypothetical protein